MIHLLDIADFDAGAIRTMLDLATRPVADLGAPLAGRGAALIFEKPSARTRHSMEIAVAELGGHPVYTRGEEIGMGVREPVGDVVRVFAGYHALVAGRVFDHQLLVEMAAADVVPIVNMLSDHSHPLQALADALTMETEFGSLAGRRIAWVGDYNNVARSLGEVCARLGAHLAFACPGGFAPSAAELERLVVLGAASAEYFGRAIEATADADAVHADTFVSMGQEADKAERLRIFEGFTVDHTVMGAAKPSAVFMHCLPAYRGIEVTTDVIDGLQSRVIAQAHNRLHAARGALAYLLQANR